MMEYGSGLARQGWQCPLCGRVYSPDTSMCFYCGGEQKTAYSTTDPAIHPKTYEPYTTPIQEWGRSTTVKVIAPATISHADMAPTTREAALEMLGLIDR